MSPLRKPIAVLCVGALAVIAVLAGPSSGATLAQTEALKRAAKSGKMIERRRAARRLFALGTPAEKAILGLAQSDDVVIKRAALRRVHELRGAKALPVLKAALSDPRPLVRIVAVEELLAMKPRTEEVNALLTQAVRDEDTAVRKTAADAFWTFHRNVVPLRKRPGWDHAIEVIACMRLPKTGWKFRVDPSRCGHVRKWFDPELDERDWLDIEIEKFWHVARPEAVGRYMGIGWYRTVVTLPQKPEGAINEVVLRFDAVDESTWLWINGEYAGMHDIGPNGWRTTFDVDVTPFVKWGKPNQIAVRVLNTAGAGGIYKPVEFQVLK